MIPIIRVHRWWQDKKQTSGTCSVVLANGFPTFSSLSLERGWMGNKNNISCLPIGTYDVVLEWSEKFEMYLWEIKNVPNRSECKFHSANYRLDLQGCIALGSEYRLLNSDNYPDVTSSKATMKRFHKALEGNIKAVLIVTGAHTQIF